MAGVDDEWKTLYVEYEKIPGYMPAMTMPLPVADPDNVPALKHDDAIQFQMKGTGDGAWIDAVATIADTDVDRHPARSLQPIPGASEAGGQMLQEGDSTEISRMTTHFGVFTKTDGGGITHNLVTAVIGPDGPVERLFRGNDWSPPDVLTAVQEVPL